MPPLHLTPFELLLLGHILGDFFFQPRWMAVNKSGSSTKTFLHCLVYTFCIAIFTNFNPVWLLAVFIPHFIIDRFSLGDAWLDFVKSRPLKGFVTEGHKEIPDLKDANREENYRILKGAFSGICYVIVDNGMHIFSMLITWKIIFG
jgi:hypothetical protein